MCYSYTFLRHYSSSVTKMILKMQAHISSCFSFQLLVFFMMSVHLFFSIETGHCPESYEVPLLTEAFCDHIVEEAEHAQNWFAYIHSKLVV